jgi:cytochrome c biogenesis protein CcmG, thiol:disulfide interchange protein DsbE
VSPKIVAQGFALALVAGLLALLVWKLSHDSPVHLEVGRPVPNFRLSRLDTRGNLQLSSLRGRPVVLNFWASWCIPCKAEAPLLESAATRWRDRGVVVLGVDSRDFSGDARRFMRKHQLTYPMVKDGSGSRADSWGVDGYPETFFIDRDGRLTKHLVGQIPSRAELDSAIRESLRS